MGLTIEHLTDEVLSLPSEARAMLADRLVESLDPAEDGVVHRLWMAEADRRRVDLQSGRVIGIPAEQVMTGLREKYAR